MKNKSLVNMGAGIAALAIVVSCCGRGKAPVAEKAMEETPSVEAMLTQMRNDTSFVRQLDSMAKVNLGPGARCIDPVKHTFAYDGRTWVYNSDWGGILEIPSDYIACDDTWQAVVSYHGSTILSPDSLVVISFYEGFEAFTEEEFIENARTQFSDQPFVKVTSYKEAVTEFRSGFRSRTVLMETMTDDGIKGYFRQIYRDALEVQHSVSIQFPEGMEPQLEEVIAMVSRYPFGPSGKDPAGDCVN